MTEPKCKEFFEGLTEEEKELSLQTINVEMTVEEAAYIGSCIEGTIEDLRKEKSNTTIIPTLQNIYDRLQLTVAQIRRGLEDD